MRCARPATRLAGRCWRAVGKPSQEMQKARQPHPHAGMVVLRKLTNGFYFHQLGSWHLLDQRSEKGTWHPLASVPGLEPARSRERLRTSCSSPARLVRPLCGGHVFASGKLYVYLLPCPCAEKWIPQATEIASWRHRFARLVDSACTVQGENMPVFVLLQVIRHEIDGVT